MGGEQKNQLRKQMIHKHIMNRIGNIKVVEDGSLTQTWEGKSCICSDSWTCTDLVWAASLIPP